MADVKQTQNLNLSKIIAAIFGGLVCTVALTICITLLWPFGDTVEQIFAGGTFFFIFWAALFYWAILASGSTQSWLRLFTIFIPVLTLDIIILATGP